jgi:hypothetical protein
MLLDRVLLEEELFVCRISPGSKTLSYVLYFLWNLQEAWC